MGRLLWLIALIAVLGLIGINMSSFWEVFSTLTNTGDQSSEHAAAIDANRQLEELKRQPAQTDPEKWRALLQQLSELAIADEIHEELKPEQIKERWLGEPPATDEQIAEAEQRLGVKLPPSYVAFLKVSNGWHYPNPFVARVAGTEELGYLRDIDPDLISAWNSGYDSEAVEEASGQEWPEKHLANTILINVPSDFDDASNLMLNPATVQDGEMEAWFFSSWTPGADAHPSFWHLMASQAITWPK